MAPTASLAPTFPAPGKIDHFIAADKRGASLTVLVVPSRKSEHSGARDDKLA
jgi:hypothetical protein